MKFGYSAYEILRVERQASTAQICAAHGELTQATAGRSDLPERVRANLQRSLDDALFTLSDPALRAEHDAWIARHENGARLDGANSYILAEQQNTEHAQAAQPSTPEARSRNWFVRMRAWFAAPRTPQ